MVAADYAISTCFTDPQGIYVNLYVPAAIAWTQNNQPCGLAIETEYPYASSVSMTLQLPRPEAFAVNLRIPEWAQGASVQINGRERQSLPPGQFAALRREWRSGDRIELELPLTQRLESIEAAQPDTVALMAGPLTLMRILEAGGETGGVTRANLLAAGRDPRSRHVWQVNTSSGAVTLKPFLDIDAESYSVYQTVQPS
jgi:hypothetical protein